MKRSALWSVVVCVLVTGVVALPAPARAWQAFARITTAAGSIDGDVTLKGFEKQVNILGIGNEMERSIIEGSFGSPRLGTLRLGTLKLVKGFDVATPKLLTAMAANTVMTKFEITIFKSTPTGSAPGFKISLANAQIQRLDTAYDPGATPSALEKLDLLYEKLVWQDLITGATGSTP